MVSSRPPVSGSKQCVCSPRPQVCYLLRQCHGAVMQATSDGMQKHTMWRPCSTTTRHYPCMQMLLHCPALRPSLATCMPCSEICNLCLAISTIASCKRPMVKGRAATDVLDMLLHMRRTWDATAHTCARAAPKTQLYMHTAHLQVIQLEAVLLINHADRGKGGPLASTHSPGPAAHVPPCVLHNVLELV